MGWHSFGISERREEVRYHELFPFGIMGFVKPVHAQKWQGQRMVLVLMWGPGTAQVVVVWFTLFLLTPLE